MIAAYVYVIKKKPGNDMTISDEECRYLNGLLGGNNKKTITINENPDEIAKIMSIFGIKCDLSGEISPECPRYEESCKGCTYSVRCPNEKQYSVAMKRMKEDISLELKRR